MMNFPAASTMGQPGEVLFTAATAMEMAPFLEAWRHPAPPATLLTGIGPVEAATTVSLELGRTAGRFVAVVNFGVAGAYVDDSGRARAALLDLCLAEREVLADLGIAQDDDVIPFDPAELPVTNHFPLDPDLLGRAAAILQRGGLDPRQGTFCTVCGASGSLRRGSALARRHLGLCENMEGGGVARACKVWGLPLLEIRCISNLVEDRDRKHWRLAEACQKAATAAALVGLGLVPFTHTVPDDRMTQPMQGGPPAATLPITNIAEKRNGH